MHQARCNHLPAATSGVASTAAPRRAAAAAAAEGEAAGEAAEGEAAGEAPAAETSDCLLDPCQGRRQVLHRAAGALALLLAGPTAVQAASAAGAPLAAPLPPLPPGPRFLSAEAQASVDAALAKVVTKGKAPAALRLVFHDAATYRIASGDGGANASVRFELDRPESFGLKRSWRLIEMLQQELRDSPAAVREVSQADLIALAAAHAVLVTGGPRIRVPVGRRDVAVADAPGRMAGEDFPVAQLRATFAAAGLDVREMVVLSGSHTIGGKGFGDSVTFDNAYFTTLLARPWLNTSDAMAKMVGLPSDHVLVDDEECLAIIKEYAQDQAKFFVDFSAAFLKLASLNAVWV